MVTTSRVTFQENMTSKMGSSSSRSSRRTTFTSAKPPSFAFRGTNGQCTHLTMARLFTRKFKCAQCLQVGSFGWLYRCTQDRELLLENDMDYGVEDSYDSLAGIFERSTEPKKRGPAARLSNLSFFKEVSQAQLETYTNEQIALILEQRAHVQEVVEDPDLGIVDLPLTSTTTPVSSVTTKDAPTPAASSDELPPKPWLPLRGGECQYKCCHACRPTLNERSPLRLNAIVDGELPATAVLGFGFHLWKRRPVHDAAIVKNLGLRPNPPPRGSPIPDKDPSPVTPLSPIMTPTPSTPSHHHLPASTRPVVRRHSTLGLNQEAVLDPVCPETPHIEASPNFTDQVPILRKPRDIPLPPDTVLPVQISPSNLKRIGTQFNLREFPLISIPQRRGVTLSPLNLSPNTITNATMGQDSTTGQLTADVFQDGEMVKKEFDGSSYFPPVPDLSSESAVSAVEPAVLTPMEEREQGEGMVFGKEPLETEGGVAILEESVEQHVPDVITQF